MADSTDRDFRIAAVIGTSRPGNFTGMALRLVADELRQNSVNVDIIDPAEMKLNFPGDEETDDAKRMQEAISGATGIVFASPEYHGTFSAMSKLIIENMGFPSALARKPVALLGVAAGQIGAIKALEHLSGVFLHVGAIVLPGYVSVPNVNSVFDENGNCLDEKIEARIRGTAGKLTTYIAENICPRLTLEEMLREEAA